MFGMNTIHPTKVSEILGVSLKTVYNMQKRGDLPDPVTRMGILRFIEARQDEVRAIESRLGAFMQAEAEREQIPLFQEAQ